MRSSKGVQRVLGLGLGLERGRAELRRGPATLRFRRVAQGIIVKQQSLENVSPLPTLWRRYDIVQPGACVALRAMRPRVVRRGRNQL
jgi:hypothetical protein